MSPAHRPVTAPAIAPSFVWPFQVIAKAAGNTAPPIRRPMTRKSQPRSMPMAFQMQAKSAMTRPHMPIPMCATKMS